MSSSATLDDLQVVLEQIDLEPPTLLVTVKNNNSLTPLTVLTWDSPLDPNAMNQGVFTLTDIISGTETRGPNIKAKRLLPPPGDALSEIPPKSDITRKIRLEAHWIPTNGEMFRVQTTGFWKAVWPKSKAQLSDQDLRTMSGDDVLTGDFMSPQIEVKVSSTKVQGAV